MLGQTWRQSLGQGSVAEVHAWEGVSVSSACHSKDHTQAVKPIGVNCLTALEAVSPRSTCWLGWSPRRPLSLWLVDGHLLVSL